MLSIQEATMLTLKVNGEEYSLDVSPDTPLLWVLRESLGLTGAKFGCGLGQCGACTVLARWQRRPLLRHPGGPGRRQRGHHH